MAQKIQLRRDTAANWTTVNPTLSQGEPGFETDTGKFKIGTGLADWTSLDYANTSTTSGGSGASAFADLTGQISQSQIPTGQSAIIIPSQLQTTNTGASGQVLSLNNSGQFTWSTVSGGGNLAIVATTGNYDDLTHKPTFTTGNQRIFSNVAVPPGSLVEAYQYEIVTVGGSNWVIAGAANNNVGTVFTAINNGSGAGGTGTVRRVGNFAVALTGSYLDLLDAPTTLSSFTDDVGYLNTATMSNYVTTSQVSDIVAQEIDNVMATSGTFFAVVQELAAASTNTSVTTALDNRLRIDVNTQNLSTQQKANGVTNLGLASVAVSGSYNDLVDVPNTFSITPATESEIGGVIVGSGISVDHTGRISVNTSTVNISMIAPDNLKGQLDQAAGQLRGDFNYLYFAKSSFNPGPYTIDQTVTTSTNSVTSGASQWLAAIDNAKAGYQAGQWRLYDPTKSTSYSIIGMATAGGVATVTIDNTITYNASDVYYIQQTDTWSRIAQMDSYGTQKSSIGGLESTSVSGTVTLAGGQTGGTTATMFVLDCTGVSYGELAISFTDSNNTEYYKGTIEVHLYPDNTYIVQPNTAGNKTDRVGIGFTSGANAPFTNAALIKIPVFNTDINIATNLTNTTCQITNIKYAWLVRSNI